VAKQLFFARRYAESRAAYETLVHDGYPGARVYFDLAELSEVTGRPRDAVHWLRQARATQRDSVGVAALTDAATDRAAIRLLDDDARRAIARLDADARAGRVVSYSSYATAYATLRDTAATLRWLDSMLVHRDSYRPQVRVDPVFDFLRGEPRYGAWESRSGLPPRRAGTRFTVLGDTSAAR
jgi:hypothetical protein